MDEAEVGAVLCALAGPRRGDRVGAVGAPPLALRALLAATGSQAPVAERARVAVTGVSAGDAAAAAALLAPGGRLVGVAADEDDAVALVRALGLALRHVEPVAQQVAWSAVAPLPP